MKHFKLTFSVDIYSDDDDNIPCAVLRNHLNTLLGRECNNSYLFRNLDYTLTWKDEK
jgi:hypothetical protein